jgi:hypothetical protein
VKVYIAQLLCVNRHCILAHPAECETPAQIDGLQHELMGAYREMLQQEIVNPWCAICRSRNFHVETAPTQFRTMAEAGPHLKVAEALQKISADWLKGQMN